MTASEPAPVRASIVGSAIGTAYGVTSRFAVEAGVFGDAFAVMSLAFIFVVPLVIGALATRRLERPSWKQQLFLPWVPMVLVVATATAIGLEGAICVFMSLPVLLLLSSVGGVIGTSPAMRPRGMQPMLLVLPLLAGSAERGIAAPDRFVDTLTEVRIAAPPSVVWPLVASVDSIRPEERRPALFTRLGFPLPVSANITGAGVGAIRRARFEHGLVFTETVTDWEPNRRLTFTIDPNTAGIPATTLDPHVTIGGPFFDVLTGTYELEPLDGGRATRLVLRSRHRVSTRFNFYAAWWADRIMTSIQANILAVHKARAERARTASSAT